MANRHRGEVSADIGGRRYTLCLTLGALAELESAFGAGNLVSLAQRFEAGALSARDIIAIIGCGLRGGGEAVADDTVAAMNFAGGLQGAVDIAVDLIGATFGSSGEKPANPPAPQDA